MAWILEWHRFATIYYCGLWLRQILWSEVDPADCLSTMGLKGCLFSCGCEIVRAIESSMAFLTNMHRGDRSYQSLLFRGKGTIIDHYYLFRCGVAGNSLSLASSLLSPLLLGYK